MYIAKLHVLLGQYEKAWNVFSSLKKGYTQSYYIDMADLILTHGHTPVDKPSHTTNERYALSLLDHLKSTQSSNSLTRNRPQRGKESSKAEADQITHPGYVKQSYIQKKTQRLKEKATQESQSSDAAQRSQNTDGENRRNPQEFHPSVSRGRGKKRPADLVEKPLSKRPRLSGSESSTLSGSDTHVRPLLRESIILDNDPREVSSADLLSQDSDPVVFEELFIPTQNMYQTSYYDCFQEYCSGYNLRHQEAMVHYQGLLKKVRIHHFRELEIKCLLKLGQIPQNPDNIACLKVALSLLKGMGLTELEVRCNLALGKIPEYKYRIDHLETALWLVENIGNELLRAEIYLTLGKIPGYIHQIRCLEDTLTRLGNTGNDLLRAEICLALGKIPGYIHQIKCLEDALRLVENTGNDLLRAEICLALGKIPGYKDGISYLKDALRLVGTTGNDLLRAKICLALGKIPGYKDQIGCLEDALEYLRHTNEWRLEANAHLTLARVYGGRRKNQEALAQCEKGLLILKQQGIDRSNDLCAALEKCQQKLIGFFRGNQG